MKAILTDITKCNGCLECVAACKKANGLGEDVPRDWQKDDGLSAKNWTSIIRKPDDHFVRKQCRHCLEPACVASCPVGALHKTPEGPVIYDSNKCLGCRYCMLACPYGIPRYDWDRPVPYVRKCIMCYQRIIKGEQPACTAACPQQATIFGERDELLRIAHDRIWGAPGKYRQMVYGEHEIGGTSVLYISDIDLSFLSYGSHLDSKPLPKATEPAMKAVPFAFVGMGTVMYGLNWIIGRRIRLNDKSKKKEDHETS
jgi:formate dehydrogenase iron-sulfur subunit